MKKPFFLSLLLFFALLCLSGFFALIKYRDNIRQNRQSAKAAEISLTLLEGWSVADIDEYLVKKDVSKKGQFVQAQKNFDAYPYSILSFRPKKADLEGFLFPDTYQIYDPKTQKNTGSSLVDTNTQLIVKMLDNFQNKFTPQMREQAAKQKMSVYEIVTLASIIEKETGRAGVGEKVTGELSDERKVVAGIFYNRLKTGQPLQSDATINYITEKKSPSVSAADLAIDSPYNTYKYAGLPLGPIANPSLSSIVAALYPQTTDYQYFLTDPVTHKAIFAKTYGEHLKNKAKYLKN